MEIGNATAEERQVLEKRCASDNIIIASAEEEEEDYE